MTQPFQKTVEDRIGTDGLAMAEARFGSQRALFALIDYWNNFWLELDTIERERALALQRWEDDGGAC